MTNDRQKGAAYQSPASKKLRRYPMVTQENICERCSDNKIILDSEKVVCRGCNNAFHAVCKTKNTLSDDAICPGAFLKTFKQISVKYGNHSNRYGNFVFICDSCLPSIQFPNTDEHKENMKKNKETKKDLEDMKTDIDKHMDDVKKVLEKEFKELNAANNFAFETLKEKIKQLEEFKKEVVVPMNMENDLEVDKTSTNKYVMKTVAFEEPIENYVTKKESEDILKYLMDDITSKFEKEGERSVMYFGEENYKYSQRSHEMKEIPPQILKVMERINESTTDEYGKVNSCLITKYDDGNQWIPAHSDDEAEIHPESTIYTLSLGAVRTMRFKNTRTNEPNTDIVLSDKSLISFTRLSQEIYSHSIIPNPTLKTARYSLTFRNISRYNVNSTLLLGDSNTKHLRFGNTSRETFGVWMPGKRLPCMTIEQIPAPENLAPYKNIVIHTGINDVKDTDITHVDRIVRILEERCLAIKSAFPNSKIYICPILPTKDPEKKPKVCSLNRGITRIAQKHPGKLSLTENYHNLFSNENNLMAPTMGKWFNGSPSGDYLHLGKRGITMLAKCIKHVVLRRKGLLTSERNNHSIIHRGIPPNPPSRRNPVYNGDYKSAVYKNVSYNGIR